MNLEFLELNLGTKSILTSISNTNSSNRRVSTPAGQVPCLFSDIFWHSRDIAAIILLICKFTFEKKI